MRYLLFIFSQRVRYLLICAFSQWMRNIFSQVRYLVHLYILSVNVTCIISECVRYFIIISISEINYMIRNWSILGQQLPIFVQKLNNIVTETKFVGISFDYIHIYWLHIYMQRVYLQIYLANNIAEINYLWRMPWMNDKIMIIIYSNLTRAYSAYFLLRSHKWH